MIGFVTSYTAALLHSICNCAIITIVITILKIAAQWRKKLHAYFILSD